jgi:hypothetical protein
MFTQFRRMTKTLVDHALNSRGQQNVGGDIQNIRICASGPTAPNGCDLRQIGGYACGRRSQRL